MAKVKIFGAGSIGNHLAHACRTAGWDVLICDLDPAALERTKTDIYPSRYGKWDKEIELATPDQAPDEKYDLVIIGTPPDHHLPIALDVLEKNPPKVLMVEKPVCPPSLENAQKVLDLAEAAGTFACVGYNHTLTDNTVAAEKLIAENKLGAPLTVSAKFREHWGGIFGAHPWLSGPQDSYLGFWEHGGGASGEHSHAINIWQHFAHVCDMGRITEVSSVMDMVDDGKVKYDRICLMNVKTEKGFVGDIAQDVLTEPAQKMVRVQCEDGFVEWIVNIDGGHDAVRHWAGQGEVSEELISKTRPQDFENEIKHIGEIMNGASTKDSPISLRRGLDSMLVVAAAHASHTAQKTVKINYEAGYAPEAVEYI